MYFSYDKITILKIMLMMHLISFFLLLQQLMRCSSKDYLVNKNKPWITKSLLISIKKRKKVHTQKYIM